VKFLVLGAGPAGLGAALGLARRGETDWELWEAGDAPGGLSSTVVDGHGYAWDIGGHVVFSHYEDFDRLLDRAIEPDDWLRHKRAARVRILGGWAPYPLQYNIHRLPEPERERCHAGLVEAAGRTPGGGFRDFEALVRGRMGDALADLFLLPLNRKTWACPPDELGTGWVGERVAFPDLKRVRESIERGIDSDDWGPNSTFRFPRRGGTGAIWTAAAALLPEGRLVLRRRVVSIDAGARSATASDGTVAGYEHLISTVPLDELVRIARLSGLEGAASGLSRSSLHVIGVALEGSPQGEARSACWMYFPEPEFPFFRVTVFSNYSPHNVPDPARNWSLLAEVSAPPGGPAEVPGLIDQTIRGLGAAGLIRPADRVHHVWHRYVEHAYPVPTLRRDEALGELLPALEAFGILSRGRFGAWRYEVGNQDHCFMQGAEAVDRILLGTPESVLADGRG